MEELILNIFYIMIICLIVCFICQIAHEIYLYFINYKTTVHIESGVVIDKKDELNQVPILIGTNIFSNFNREEYLIVKCNDNTYEILQYSDEYSIGDKVQVQVKEYKNKVISYEIL